MKERIIYCPAHFGNFYECASYNELRSYFKELKGWGATGIGTWFDPANMVDPFGKNPLYKWAREKPMQEMERKRDLLCAARDEGLKVSLALSPNVVYIDQLSQELAADTSEKGYIGPNLCPCKPKAKEIILQNQQNILHFLKEKKLSLDYVLAIIKDYGGCACAKCFPWIKTYLSLFEEIVPLILKYHPRARVQFLTWWLNQKEIEAIVSYLNEKKPNWAEGINLSLGYAREVPVIELSSPYQKTVFLHISYSSGHSDKYGVKGGVVAPERLEEIFKKMPSDIIGFQAYSEGIYDDLNKYLSCQLGRNANLNVHQLVEKYCQDYFNLEGKDLKKTIEAIYELEHIEENKERGPAIFEVFKEVGERHDLFDNWRFALLFIRAKVADIEFEIGDEERWEEETAKLTSEGVRAYIRKIDYLVKKRRTILEELERKIYRIGSQCHGLDIDKDYQIWQRWKKRIREEKIVDFTKSSSNL